MAGALPHYTHGPDSYQVSAQVLGGQLVIPDAGPAATVSVAGAAAINVLGVAGIDAAPIVSQAGNTTGYGQPLTDISVLPDYVSVWHGVDIHVTYAAAATFGVLLKAAALGQVTPWVSGVDTNPATIVGRCTQPGGVAGAATVARARIYG
ncbi:MAG TPA: hypothetical protein VK586_02585 [Streptosporangiaceae bacterium]|nr:hypothetical protein [Streptosporangiaceae bacterium]